MDIFSQLKSHIIDAAKSVLGEDIATSGITVEPPKDAAHGDIASNVAMVLCKPHGRQPRALAEEIAEKLANCEMVEKIDVAGPGFMNFRLKPIVIQNVVLAANALGDKFGQSTFGNGTRINVEYVSANPTGPLHAGHMRGAVVGDALAGLLENAGFDVTREYYVNDGGAQVDVLARSVYLRYLEAHGQSVEFPDGTYPGEYLIEFGMAMKAKFGDTFMGKPESEWLEIFREEGTNAMLELIKSDLKSLG